MSGFKAILIAGIVLLVGGTAVVIAFLTAEDAGPSPTTMSVVSTTSTVLQGSLPGLAEQQRGDLAGAQAAALAHLQSNPDDTRARYFLALTYEQSGELERAIAIYQEILEVDPRDFEAYYHIGALQYAQGLVDEAQASFEESLQLNGDFTAAKVALAEVLAELGEPDRAIELYFEIIESRPLGTSLDVIRVALARLLIDVGQQENALIQLNKALAENPENAEALALLTELEGLGTQPGGEPEAPTPPEGSSDGGSAVGAAGTTTTTASG